MATYRFYKKIKDELAKKIYKVTNGPLSAFFERAMSDNFDNICSAFVAYFNDQPTIYAEYIKSAINDIGAVNKLKSPYPCEMSTKTHPGLSKAMEVEWYKIYKKTPNYRRGSRRGTEEAIIFRACVYAQIAKEENKGNNGSVDNEVTTLKEKVRQLEKLNESLNLENSRLQQKIQGIAEIIEKSLVPGEKKSTKDSSGQPEIVFSSHRVEPPTTETRKSVAAPLSMCASGGDPGNDHSLKLLQKFKNNDFNYGRKQPGSPVTPTIFKGKRLEYGKNLIAKAQREAQIDLGYGDKLLCVYCLKEINMEISGTNKGGGTIEHIVPRIVDLPIGDLESVANLAIVHNGCNLRLGAKKYRPVSEEVYNIQAQKVNNSYRSGTAAHRLKEFLMDKHSVHNRRDIPESMQKKGAYFQVNIVQNEDVRIVLSQKLKNCANTIWDAMCVRADRNKLSDSEKGSRMAMATHYGVKLDLKNKFVIIKRNALDRSFKNLLPDMFKSAGVDIEQFIKKHGGGDIKIPLSLAA